MVNKKIAITWHSEKVKVADLIENPNNPKRPDAKGRKRLIKSIKEFGLVTGGVCNTDNMLIDGHSRKDVLLELGIEEVQVMKPSKTLTPKQYKSFNAIFDLAKAGDPHMGMIEELFTEEFMNEWDLDKKNAAVKQNAKYPLVPEFDEKYDAIIIICNKAIDTTYIKNALGIDRAQSYKNTYVGESNVLTADQFIKKWQQNSKS